jgi:uncharacterized SAM-binding protein YcdF (DUF218 family)
MDLIFALRSLAKALVLPPAGPLLVMLAGLLVARRAPRTGRAMAWVGAISMLLLCLPIVAWWLTRPFDREPFDVLQAAEAQAVVILGGGTQRNAPEYGGDTLGRLTLERVRYGAVVAKRTGLPVLVSGGTTLGATSSEAALMERALAHEYGVPVRWIEDRSRNTHENARYSAQLLKHEGVDRVVLVAHAIDMPRATAEFADAGVTTVPAATGLPSRGGLAPMDFVPSPGALQRSHDALYELLANLVRRLGAGERR